MAIKRLYDTLVGATVNVNQLARPQYITAAGVALTVNDDGSCTIDGTATSNNSIPIMSVAESVGTLIQNRVYYMVGCPSGGSGSTYYVGVAGFEIDLGNGGLFKHTYAWKSTQFRFDFFAGQTFNNVKTYFKYIDLTAYFGSTIADYLYSLETATAGAGIAKLREWGFFTEEYIPYNPGTLESVEARSHVMRGFNQWDEEWEVGIFNYNTGASLTLSNQIRSKNYISVVPNTTYYIKAPGPVLVLGYDKNKNFLRRLWYTTGNATFVTRTVSGDDCYYIKFCTIDSPAYGNTYNHDICINLSSDRNGEYEPYHEYSYDLGTDTLRGLFKLDSENRLYADGDTKTSDGTITRYYGTRAYQSGDESLADAITDGTTTMYKLTTPTTEQSTPFTSPQVCYPDGTEEYVTSNGLPVGHETRYQL